MQDRRYGSPGPGAFGAGSSGGDVIPIVCRGIVSLQTVQFGRGRAHDSKMLAKLVSEPRRVSGEEVRCETQERPQEKS
jgi:hypothetical protein